MGKIEQLRRVFKPHVDMRKPGTGRAPPEDLREAAPRRTGAAARRVARNWRVFSASQSPGTLASKTAGEMRASRALTASGVRPARGRPMMVSHQLARRSSVLLLPWTTASAQSGR